MPTHTASGLYSVHLSTATTWRGGENQIWLLAQGLQERGTRALVLAPPGAPLLERCRVSGVPARELAVRGGSDVRGTLALAKLLQKEKPDVLHLHDGHSVLPGQMAARLPSLKKMGVVAHRRTVFRVQGRWKYGGRVNRVIAISAAARQTLLDAQVPEASIRVVHSGLEFPEKLPPDDSAVINLRQKCGLPGAAFMIAHAAAFTSEKRQSDMLQALRAVNDRLKERAVPGVHLVLAGSGALEETLRAEVRKCTLEQNVHFAGFLRDLRPLWAASHMVLFASDAEGLCTALIEAQGAGLPAVITRAGGMTEVIEEGVTGLGVGIGQVAEMAAAILRLHADAALRRRMGAAAEQRARERFSARAMVDGVLSVYREL